MDNRVCRKCNNEKPLTKEFFYYRRNTAYDPNTYYYRWDCKVCCSEKGKKVYNKTAIVRRRKRRRTDADYANEIRIKNKISRDNRVGFKDNCRMYERDLIENLKENYVKKLCMAYFKIKRKEVTDEMVGLYRTHIKLQRLCK